MTKKNNKINTTQLCVLLLGVFLSMRPILENALQAEVLDNDCIITTFFAGIINLCLTMLVCYVIYKNPNKSFYDIIKNFLGTTITKIIMFLLAIIFLFKLIIVDYQMADLLYDAIYSDINWIYFVVPIYLTFLFLALKNIKTIARCYQFFIPFAVVIFIAALLISTANANFENLLPFFDHNYSSFIEGFSYILIQSGEFIFLFTFMENIISKDKHYFKKISITLIIIFILVMCFYILFIAVLGKLAPYVQESIIKMTQLDHYTYGYFKIDIFISVMYIPIIILQCALCVYSASYSLNKSIKLNKKISSFLIILALFLTKFIPGLNNKVIIDFFYKTIGIYVIIFVLFLPIILIIASNKKEKNYEKISR
ncbi:MAG: hypothetical protein E7359_00615 [Clostridiales bacterium]|nr:hypothetical protein [Clostridiales bacterium]